MWWVMFLSRCSLLMGGVSMYLVPRLRSVMSVLVCGLLGMSKLIILVLPVFMWPSRLYVWSVMVWQLHVLLV